MSLIRQLWLAVVVVMALAFGGSFVISTVAARHYLSQQLMVKNIDNATTLALSMSQMHKDPVTLELLISAQFDVGHYRQITLRDPNGKVIVTRNSDAPVQGVPAAFMSLVPIKVPAGVAQIQDGWKQYGTLTVESHDQYAYVELWQGTQRLALWFVIAALSVGVIGTALLRLILRPLDAVLAQADAIGERRFIIGRIPKTLEFQRLVRAMNTLSGRVQQMLAEEAGRVEQLRHQAQTDPVTGLRNRETFLATLDDALRRHDVSASGALFILRIPDLAERNQRIGRAAVDRLLQRIAGRLVDAGHHQPVPWIVSRLNAGDFAVLAPGETDQQAVAEKVLVQARLAFENAGDPPTLHLGGSRYLHDEARSAVLARADGALTQAEQSGQALVIAALPPAGTTLPTDLIAWRQLLTGALHSHGVQLGRYPVKDNHQQVLHYESPLRLQLGEQWVPAAGFIAWASRLGLMPDLDLRVVEAALASISSHQSAVSVVISAEALRDENFLTHLASLLRQHPALTSRLWLEVPEYGALRHLPEFQRFCRTLKPLGCKLGLKHAGHQFSRIADLLDLGLDYLKIDGAIVQSAHDDGNHQAFLRSLCTVSHTVGLQAIAAGVSDAGDLPVLKDLGVDAYTGPAIQG